MRILLYAAGFAAACAVAALPHSASAQPLIDWQKIQIKTTDLGHQTYLLEGQGGNITIAVGTDGIIMVDGQFAPLSDKIKAAVKAISPLPVKYLINTHYHGDHTGGNVNFAKDGAIIVAHDNIRVRLAAGTVAGLTGARAAPMPPEGLPRETYTGGSMTIEVGGRKALLTYAANAHTDGDTWVYFEDANVLSTGDNFNNLKRYQNVDFANGGDIRGMVRANAAFLAVANESTKVVPGHGGLATRADVVEFHAMAVTSKERVEKLYNAGKTEAEVLAARPMKDYDVKWGPSDQAAESHLKNVYRSFGRL